MTNLTTVGVTGGPGPRTVVLLQFMDPCHHLLTKIDWPGPWKIVLSTVRRFWTLFVDHNRWTRSTHCGPIHGLSYSFVVWFRECVCGPRSIDLFYWPWSYLLSILLLRRLVLRMVMWTKINRPSPRDRTHGPSCSFVVLSRKWLFGPRSTNLLNGPLSDQCFIGPGNHLETLCFLWTMIDGPGPRNMVPPFSLGCLRIWHLRFY